MCAYAFLFVLLNLFCNLNARAVDEGDVEWTGDWGFAAVECPDCGSMYFAGPVESLDEAWEELKDFFCDECGYCKEIANSSCWYEHHCVISGDCADDDYCEGCFADLGVKFCSNCTSDFDSSLNHCNFCHGHYGCDAGDECGCDMNNVYSHCTNCHGDECSYCGNAIVIGGEEVTALTEGGCLEHLICVDCIDQDPDHCRECHFCDEEVCIECGLCVPCADEEEHCPECGYCFGYDNKYELCHSGGDHCVQCCIENEWLCEQCDFCFEGREVELCFDCGLCMICCMENCEKEGCSHGYCIMSSDFEEHLCPECMLCPNDRECEYCLLCPDCQPNYHCDHGFCPDSFEWDDHLCAGCGDCFEMEELCETCGKCEDCWEHCQHGFCPEDIPFGRYGQRKRAKASASEHFICSQCDNCFYGNAYCNTCELCLTCCEANTEVKGCKHRLCISSEAFAEHWCYADDQCLALCNHNPSCAHADVDEEWICDDNAHWHICNDCGMAVNKAIHTEGDPLTIVEPNPEAHKKGLANVSCSVCDQYMATISIPFMEIPEDGSPYIIIQPNDYTGKTDMNGWNGAPDRFATFRVRAGGKNLSYQWYENKHNSGFKPLDESQLEGPSVGLYEGAHTAELRILVPTDACDPTNTYHYYCVVSNAHGSVISNTVHFRAQHVYGYYRNNGDGTHTNDCFGECETILGVFPHRYGEWTLQRPATETQTGLRVQRCLDCNAANGEYIPMVEPNHVHVFNVAKYSPLQHWFTCKCGLSEPNGVAAEHTFGTPVVTTQPTEKKKGEQTLTCTVCSYSKTETLDKLPHTHDWYDMSWSNFQNPDRAGYSSKQHYVHCKKCDQIKTEDHDFLPWSIVLPPTKKKNGRICRECDVCVYVEYKEYPYGKNPIMVEFGTANFDYSSPGNTIIVKYKKVPGLSFIRWMDAYYDGGPLVPLPATNMESETITFSMPDGPVGLTPKTGRCDHTGGTIMGQRLEPTCMGYGHEPDVLCAVCTAVITEGARIEPLGHNLQATPIKGTSRMYCTVKSATGDIHNYGLGYEGDFLCKRCGKAVRGKRVPLIHEKDLGNNATSSNLKVINDVSPTCTADGYSGDVMCLYCNVRAERGHKVPRLGHDWGPWETIRQATRKVKGLEMRVCSRDESHAETFVTDYSGPDWALKADKTVVNFEFTYGETPEPQVVTFRSVGRDPIISLEGLARVLYTGIVTVKRDGMKMIITPTVEGLYDNMLTEQKELVSVKSVMTPDGERLYIEAPDIKVNMKVNKREPRMAFEKSGVSVRPGAPVEIPNLISDMEDMDLQWKSSDNKVAAFDPATGELKVLSAGNTTITATYPGSQYYKSVKRSFMLEVIGNMQFRGNMWQTVTDDATGAQGKTEREPQVVKITNTAANPGKVDFHFSGFTMPVTGVKTGSFTISGVNVTDEPVRSFYELRYYEAVPVTFGEGADAQTYMATLDASQRYRGEAPAIWLSLNRGSVTDIIWFGNEWCYFLDDVIGTDIHGTRQGTESGDIYDLSGRKVQKIQHPGVYIKDGRKVSVK